jgi:D-ribose pyranase
VKKSHLLNQPLSSVIAGLGHLDELVIADAGLPIPPSTQRIDLAVTQDIPRFHDTLRIVLTELQVEKAIVAQEMLIKSPQVHQTILALLENIPLETVPHEAFKERTRSAVAVVRTGEFTPFANIILVAGVVF